MGCLTKYWIIFDEDYSGFGIGVTAFSQADALYIIKTKVYKWREMPPVKEIIEDIDVSTLDAQHVLPFIKWPYIMRGIWYPSGFMD